MMLQHHITRYMDVFGTMLLIIFQMDADILTETLFVEVLILITQTELKVTLLPLTMGVTICGIKKDIREILCLLV